MKKLSKLKLKEFHEMSDFEMKNVVGGYYSQGGYYETENNRPVGKCRSDKCSGPCYAGDGAEPHPNLILGKCGWTYSPFIRCTCAVGYLG